MSENGEGKFYKFAKGKGVMTLPNKLTILRIFLIPVFLLFFYLNFTAHYFIALAVFGIASFTDFLDGFIARKYNLITNLGKFLDPVADKILVSAALIVMLTKAEFFTAYLGGWALVVAGCCVVIILARELLVGAFRMVAADAGVVIAADKIGKFKTVSQMISMILLLVWGGLFELVPQSLAVEIINYAGLVLFAVSTLLTIASGINYIIKNIDVLKK